jgi:hypothetical protein
MVITCSEMAAGKKEKINFSKVQHRRKRQKMRREQIGGQGRYSRCNKS